MWNAVSSERSLGLAAMPDTPGSRIVGPKARRSSWSGVCAAVVRILGETLPNVESEHAPRTRAVLVEASEAQLRSARPHVHTPWSLAYAWAAARQPQTIASFTSENRPRSLQARQQLSLSLLSYAFALFASLSLGQTRGGRVPYVFAVDQAYQARTR